MSSNNEVANAVTENGNGAKKGSRRLGCATLVFIALLLLFAIELPYPLGGSIGSAFVESFKVLVSGTPLGVKLNGECPATDKGQLDAFLITGQECLQPSNGLSKFPVMTREVANSRHPRTGKCLLEFAILEGNQRAAGHLLQSGADPHECPGSVDVLFDQFLYRSRNGGYHYVAYALHDAKFRPTDAKKFLFDAAKQGSQPGISFAVNRLKQPVDAIDADGATPLYHAIFTEPTQGSWDSVRELMALGADPNLASLHGESPMQKGRRVYEGTKWQSVFENLIQREMSRRRGKVDVH